MRRESKRQSRLARKATTAAGAALGATALFAPGAEAATFEVNSLADPGDGTCDATECTLREAVEDANAAAGADTVIFRSGLSGTINLTADDIEIYGDPLAIQGPGAGVITVDGGDTTDIFDLYGLSDPAGSVSISGLTLANGYEDVDGGAINSYYGGTDLTLTGVVITGSYALYDGGAVQLGDGTLTVVDSLLSDNDAGNEGGALYSDDGALVIDRSTISGNRPSGDMPENTRPSFSSASLYAEFTS